MQQRQTPSLNLLSAGLHRSASRRAVALTAWLALGGLGGLMAASPARAADVDIGVSIGISQPGVYGRIDIGRFPQPQVVVAQPVIVTPVPVVVGRPVQPVYMWVPPGHRKNWRKHCADYRACGTPVVFVRDDWYASHVQPYSNGRGDDRGHHDDRGRDKGHGHDKGKGKGRGRDD